MAQTPAVLKPQTIFHILLLLDLGVLFLLVILTLFTPSFFENLTFILSPRASVGCKNNPFGNGGNGPLVSRHLLKAPMIDIDSSDISSLLLVQAVFRHGDRSPMHSYPTDPHKDDWPQGYKQLTTVGMKQAYELGQYFKETYAPFIGTSYRHSEVAIRSTQLDRTIMTAECVAAGLFPLDHTNDTTSPWPTGRWQPIPIQIVPQEKDRLMRPAKSCQYIGQLSVGLRARNAIRKALINDKVLMFKLSRDTGMAINVSSLHSLSDTVFCQKTHNMTQPDWMTSDLEQQLLDYHLDRPSIAPESAKYLAGSLLDAITQIMVRKAHTEEEYLKLYLYSGHDSTVHTLMSLLGVFNEIQVPYTAAFIIELHRLDGHHYVKFLYRNDSSKPAYIRIALGCGKKLCPLDTFVEAYESYGMTDNEWNSLCVKEYSGTIQWNDGVVPLVVAALVALMGLNIFLVYKVYVYRQQIKLGPHHEQYALLNVETEGSSDSETEIYVLNETPGSNTHNGAITLGLGDIDNEEEYDFVDKERKREERDESD